MSKIESSCHSKSSESNCAARRCVVYDYPSTSEALSTSIRSIKGMEAFPTSLFGMVMHFLSGPNQKCHSCSRRKYDHQDIKHAFCRHSLPGLQFATYSALWHQIMMSKSWRTCVLTIFWYCWSIFANGVCQFLPLGNIFHVQQSTNCHGDIEQKVKCMEWTRIGTEYICGQCANQIVQVSGSWNPDNCVCLQCGEERIEVATVDHFCVGCHGGSVCHICYAANVGELGTLPDAACYECMVRWQNQWGSDPQRYYRMVSDAHLICG